MLINLIHLLFLLLTIFYEATSVANIETDSISHTKELTDEIFPRTDPEVITLIYQMLNAIDLLFAAHDIPYWIDGGTALGALRHQGCIPWDDDADLVFHIEDKERILALKPNFAEYGFFLKQQEIIRLFPSEQRRHPYIDLSGYVLCSDNTYRFDSEPLRKYFRSFFWLAEEVETLVKVPFGPLMLNAPNDMIRYVLNGYGKDCLTHATFQKHHDGAQKDITIKSKVRIVDFSPAHYKPNLSP